jgi:hypothetical protein
MIKTVWVKCAFIPTKDQHNLFAQLAACVTSSVLGKLKDTCSNPADCIYYFLHGGVHLVRSLTGGENFYGTWSPI